MLKLKMLAVVTSCLGPAAFGRLSVETHKSTLFMRIGAASRLRAAEC